MFFRSSQATSRVTVAELCAECTSVLHALDPEKVCNFNCPKWTAMCAKGTQPRGSRAAPVTCDVSEQLLKNSAPDVGKHGIISTRLPLPWRPCFDV